MKTPNNSKDSPPLVAKGHSHGETPRPAGRDSPGLSVIARDSAVSTVRKLSTSRGPVTLSQAVTAYLTAPDGPESAATRRVYGGTYRALLAALGEDAAVSDLTPAGLGEWFASRWADATPATWNTNRGALRSLLRFCETQGWITSAADLTRGTGQRKRSPDRSRALSRADVEQLLARENVSPRERTFWRLAYESAARSSELLALNAEDLDLPTAGPASCARAARPTSSPGRLRRRGSCRGC